MLRLREWSKLRSLVASGKGQCIFARSKKFARARCPLDAIRNTTYALRIAPSWLN